MRTILYHIEWGLSVLFCSGLLDHNSSQLLNLEFVLSYNSLKQIQELKTNYLNIRILVLSKPLEVFSNKQKFMFSSSCSALAAQMYCAAQLSTQQQQMYVN